MLAHRQGGRGTQWLRDPRRNGLELLGTWDTCSLPSAPAPDAAPLPQATARFLLLERKAPQPSLQLLGPQTVGDPLLPVPPARAVLLLPG